MENEENKIIEEQVVEEQKPEEAPVPEETPVPEEAPVPEGEEKLETEIEDKTEPVQEDTEEPKAEPEEPEQESEEKADSASGNNDNKDDEGEGNPDTREKVEDKVVDQEEQLTPTQEELMAQLEELRAEKEEREALEACNKEVMKVEREFNEITDDIAKKLQASFEANGIDPSKTLAELKKEDPAKATLAEQFINQAQGLRDQLQEAAIKEITKQQNEVIYRVASREFEKMGLNLEQAKEAVKTFKKIVNEVGVADLKEDLQMKVQLAAGRAKIVVPEGIAVPEAKDDVDTNVPLDTGAPLDTTEVKVPSPEIETEKQAVQKTEEESNPPAKETEPVVEKPKVEDFEEGVTGKASAGAGTMINELNVLEELAKLPYKERAKFYKEHEDVIVKALSKRG